jgi:hypothetical protein
MHFSLIYALTDARANQSTGFLPSMARKASCKELPGGAIDMPRNSSAVDVTEASSHKVATNICVAENQVCVRNFCNL